MDFKLENFDDQQEPAFDLDAKSERRKTFGEIEKKYPDKIKKSNPIKKLVHYYSKNYLFYKFIILPILLLLIAYTVPKIFQKTAKIYLEKAKSIQQTTKNEKQGRDLQRQNRPSYNPTYTYQAEPRILPKRKLVQSEKKGERQVLYSWINEDGSKSFSNIGFPTDGSYKDGKIEWY